ncbi:MAG: DUF2971 domain-containing protein [Clostridia bacterium]|nr:DUF2971 domain-containing protein [Clostridia bacterium]
MNQNIKLDFPSMKKAISKAGNLFYQYRPCRRTAETIYDIENIRHGVVYSQTPLNMNDPFDSMIGFSAEKIFEECISIVLDALKIGNQHFRTVIEVLLKHKAFGQLAEVLLIIKKIKTYLLSKQKEMHLCHLTLNRFVIQNYRTVYSKAPKDIKAKFSIDVFLALAFVVSNMGDIDINEDALLSFMQIDTHLDALLDTAKEIQKDKYFPLLQHFLSTITISCFSVSGWNNQLMWSHYANSYKGICVEYDLEKANSFFGFFYPITYSTVRPTVTLHDLGIAGYDYSLRTLVSGDANMDSIFSYLLTKNTCWKYEEEWRIINVTQEPNKPLFIDFPYIKSITFGVDIDLLCKQLLWDICKDKNIDCYELVISNDKFEIDRRLLTDEDFAFDDEKESDYISLLCSQLMAKFKEIDDNVELYLKSLEEKNIDYNLIKQIFIDIVDCLSNSYFIKQSMNRYCKYSKEDITTFEDYEEICKGVVAINEFVSGSATASSDISGVFESINSQGLIKPSDYKLCKKLAKDIDELVEKVNGFSWDEKILQNVSSQPSEE